MVREKVRGKYHVVREKVRGEYHVVREKKFAGSIMWSADCGPHDISREPMGGGLAKTQQRIIEIRLTEDPPLKCRFFAREVRRRAKRREAPRRRNVD